MQIVTRGQVLGKSKAEKLVLKGQRDEAERRNLTASPGRLGGH